MHFAKFLVSCHMSVRSETYLLVGVKMDRKKVLDLDGELNLPWRGEDAEGKIGILTDCYSDSYSVAGYCVAVARDEDVGFNLMEIDSIKLTTAYFPKVHDWLKEHKLFNLIEKDCHFARLYLLTHYH